MPAAIPFDTTDIDYIVEEYEDGYSMAELALEFSVSQPVIRRLLVGRDVVIRPRGRLAGKNS